MNRIDLCVLIFRPLKSEEVDELNSCESEVSVFTINAKYAADLKLPIKVFNSQDLTRHEDFAKECIQNLGHTHSKSNLSLIEQTTFNGVVLWHPVRFGVYHKFKNALIQKSITEQFGSDSMGSIRIYTNDQLLNKLIPDADIRLAQVSTNKTKTVSPLKFAVLFLIRSLIGLVRNGFPDKGKRIILNTVSPLSPMINANGDKEVNGLAHLHYFFKKVEQEKEFAFVSAMKFIGVKDGLFPIGQTCFSSYPASKIYHFESFVLMSLMSPKAIKRLVKYWRDLGNIFPVDENDISRVLFADFKKRRVQFIYAAVLVLGGVRMLEKMAPVCIGGDNEHSFVKRPILGAAKKMGITTYAIQHGDIHRNNFNYRFTKEDPISQLHPDMTVVWGRQTKEALVASSFYNPDNIKVVGQIRTDAISELKSRFQREANKRPYTVLFASQPFFDQALRKKMYVDFNKAAQHLPEVRFIHKPHPGETDWSFFNNIDEELGYKVNRSDQDLYVLLAQANAVVTGFSTVGIEAAYFECDLIVMDYQNEDLAGYVNDKVALQGTDHLKLIDFVMQLSSGDILLDSELRLEYIKRRVHAIDGNTSERVKTVIESL